MAAGYEVPAKAFNIKGFFDANESDIEKGFSPEGVKLKCKGTTDLPGNEGMEVKLQGDGTEITRFSSTFRYPIPDKPVAGYVGMVIEGAITDLELTTRCWKSTTWFKTREELGKEQPEVEIARRLSDLIRYKKEMKHGIDYPLNIKEGQFIDEIVKKSQTILESRALTIAGTGYAFEEDRNLSLQETLFFITPGNIISDRSLYAKSETPLNTILGGTRKGMFEYTANGETLRIIPPNTTEDGKLINRELPYEFLELKYDKATKQLKTRRALQIGKKTLYEEGYPQQSQEKFHNDLTWVIRLCPQVTQ